MPLILLHASRARIGAVQIGDARMDKAFWRDDSPDRYYNMHDSGGLDAARGLVIGLALSQVFWVGLALFLL